MGNNKEKKCEARKIIFCTGLTRSAKAGQKSIVPARPERVKRGGPCWMLKLSWMGTQRVQMKRGLLWLVPWACNATTRDFCSALAALVGPVQILFSSLYTYSILLPPSTSKLGRQPCWVDWARRSKWTNQGRTSFICTPRVPICLSF
jgi:hypothetical protein